MSQKKAISYSWGRGEGFVKKIKASLTCAEGTAGAVAKAEKMLLLLYSVNINIGP